jgi:predicted ATP-grasp superfamily ATP-dependent carboligase
VDAPEIASLSRRLLRAYEYRGFVGVEFKQDARDGRFRLMEINPRTVSGNQLAIAAGVDFPWIGYECLANSEPRPRAAERFRVGVAYVNEEWDLKAFLRLKQAGELTLLRWLGDLFRSDAKALAAIDDPLPVLVAAFRVFRAALASIVAAPFKWLRGLTGPHRGH